MPRTERKLNIVLGISIFMTFGWLVWTSKFNVNKTTAHVIEAVAVDTSREEEETAKVSNVHKTPPADQNIQVIHHHIHQSWKTKNLPERFEKWSKSWQQCFPNWNYTLWTDEDNRNLIVQHYPWMLQFYDHLPKEIYRADAVRYVYMYHYGGLYADLDAECLKPFEHLLKNYSIVFGAMEGQAGPQVMEGHVENSFFYSKAKHPFWMEVIHNMMERKFANHLLGYLTGPYMLASNINKHRPKYDKQWKIYEPQYFNPFSWICLNKAPKACKIRNRMNDEEVEECRNFYLNNGSFVIQYHSTSWDHE